MSELFAEGKIYRPRRGYLITGVVCTLTFSVVGIALVMAAYWNIDGSVRNPHEFALLVGVFAGAWVFLGLWVILEYFRKRLVVGEKGIGQQGVVRRTLIVFNDVNRLRWRRNPAEGSLVLYTPAEKLKIIFDNFTQSEKAELVSFFRQRMDLSLQEGWKDFERIYCSSGAEPQKNRKKPSVFLLLSVVFFCFSVFFLYGWWNGNRAEKMFDLGVMNGVIAVLSLLFDFVNNRPERV